MENTKTVNELESKVKQLEAVIAKMKAKQKYGLVWEDEEETAPSVIPQLIEEQKLKIVNDENKHENLLIEGDNYHSLLALQKTYKGKIDVIYIDPPYNTGNEFVYNDKIVDKEDSFRHSKWLSFMHKRLKLAKKLLSEEGVIFVSIDDNEQAQLKLLMDEVFGEKNFVNSIVVKTKTSSGVSGKTEGKGFRKGKEYLFAYSKTKEKMYLDNIYENEKISDLISRYKEEGKGYYYTRIIKNYGKKQKVGCFSNDGIVVYKHTDVEIVNISTVMREEQLTLQEAYNKYI